MHNDSLDVSAWANAEPQVSADRIDGGVTGPNRVAPAAAWTGSARLISEPPGAMERRIGRAGRCRIAERVAFVGPAARRVLPFGPDRQSDKRAAR
ncbi:hypothetical protein SAMN05192568_100444 [Methylobacterium pseudosasicola]|uniref:Uncharacterized protein n=1 Tax=Methylobacterium pseudosasicola TaxID=582667 RepID=A0A1I4H6S5_9HYPH|nr:hypothetical protein SAMN05192568_100444 [Methylobacterium pseudosasicola]